MGESLRGDETYLMEQDRMVEFSTEFDPQSFHIDPVAAKDSIYGGLIASGWHTSAALMRLNTEHLGEASMGAFGIDELRWPRPVRAGDELRLTWTILDKRVSQSKPDRGIMRVRQELHDQNDELVFSCIANMMIRVRTS